MQIQGTNRIHSPQGINAPHFSTKTAGTQATGGTAFYPQRLEDISNEFHRVEEELRSQYSLAYKPADFRPDGSFRSIYLTALRGGYVVHARTGYFAPK